MIKKRIFHIAAVGLLASLTIPAYGVMRKIMMLMPPVFKTKIDNPRCHFLLILNDIEIRPFLLKIQDFASQHSLSFIGSQGPIDLESGGVFFNLVFKDEDGVEMVVINPHNQNEVSIDFYDLNQSSNFLAIVHSFLSKLGKDYDFALHGCIERYQPSNVQ